MASDKKICPKCGKECDIGDLYCTCNYKFSFDGNDTTSSTPEDKSGYTEQLKKRVDDYSTQYHQYDSDPPPSPYDNSNDYGEPAPDSSGCGIVVLIIIVVIVACALLGVFDSNNSSNHNNSTYNNNQQNEETTNNEDYNNYPSCDADTTLKPMKKDRTDALVSVFENSKYLLNAKYSLWYRNTQSDGEGYCKSEEMIKNLFWVDPEVYIVLPINYRVYYDNDRTMIEHQNYSDMDEIINNGTFYKGSHKLSGSEVDSLLYRSLPENSNSNNSNNNYYEDNHQSYSQPATQPYRVPVTQQKKPETTIYNYQAPKPQPVKPQPPKPKTDMEKSADSFFE